MPPDISDGEDEMLSTFRRLRLKVFDYDREQVIVKEKDFFGRLCAPNTIYVSLDDFSRNLALHGPNPLWTIRMIPTWKNSFSFDGQILQMFQFEGNEIINE